MTPFPHKLQQTQHELCWPVQSTLILVQICERRLFSSYNLLHIVLLRVLFKQPPGIFLNMKSCVFFTLYGNTENSTFCFKEFQILVRENLRTPEVIGEGGNKVQQPEEDQQQHVLVVVHLHL